MIPWQIPLPLLFFDGKSGQGKHLLTPPVIHSHCPKEDYRFFHLGVCLNLGFSESKPWRMQWCQAEEEETLVICAVVSALPWKAAGHQPHRACSEKARRGAPESTHQRLWSLGGLSISFHSREWVCPLRANHPALPTVLCLDPSVAGKVLRRGESGQPGTEKLSTCWYGPWEQVNWDELRGCWGRRASAAVGAPCLQEPCSASLVRVLEPQHILPLFFVHVSIVMLFASFKKIYISLLVYPSPLEAGVQSEQKSVTFALCSFKRTSIMPGLIAGGRDMVIECKNEWMSDWMNEHMCFC